MEKITAVLDALQNIFGKGILLAGVLPMAALMTVSWFLGCWLSPSCREISDYLLRAKVTERFSIGIVSLLLFSLSSFVFWLLNPWFRQVLEGRVWATFIQDWLANGERRGLRTLQVTLQRLLDELGHYREARAVWPNALAGASTGAGVAIQDQNLISDYDRLKERVMSFHPVPYVDVSRFYERLRRELGRTRTDPAGSPRLGEVRDEFCDSVLPVGLETAEQTYYRALPQRTFRFPEQEMNVGPSRLANIQEAQRDYVARNYGIDIGVFWSDLQKTAAADKDFVGTLENAKMRLDFSVAMTVAASLFTIGWIVMNLCFGSNLTVFILVALAGVITTLMFNRLVFINYAAFAETVRTTTELFRFELLKALHLSLPANETEEKQLWLDLARRLQTGAAIPIAYHHA